MFFPTSKVTKEAEILQEGFSLIFIIRKTFTGQQYILSYYYPLNTSYCMINRILVLFSITIASILSSAAQIPITSKNNWMYVDAMLSSKEKNVHTSAIIDTGCTYCLIDSTFAADLQLSTIDTTFISYSTQKTPMSVSRVNLPQLAIGEKVYNNVLCIIVDLQGKSKEYAPSFIIGADIISRDLWNIDL